MITEDLLCELVPIENAAMADRTVIEWDKDDIDALDLKVDLLGLGCHRGKTFELIDESGVEPGFEVPASGGFTMHTIPPEDPAVYEMMGRADTMGVFQIESGPRCRCSRGSSRALRPRRRGRDRGPVRSRATWSTPTCGAATAWSR